MKRVIANRWLPVGRVPLLRSSCAAKHPGRTGAKWARKLGREAALRSADGEGHNPANGA